MLTRRCCQLACAKTTYLKDALESGAVWRWLGLTPKLQMSQLEKNAAPLRRR